MTDLSIEEEYAQLEGRLVQARERLAVLNAREEEKKQRREALLKQLSIEGVDIDDLEGEEKRIQKEVGEELKEAEGAVDRFEAELKDRTEVVYEPLTESAEEA